jgi:4-hydroxy-tetrahydrodipicolinate synthase
MMLQGLYTPNLTAFNENGDVDYAATTEHCAWLVESGVSGLVPFGTFGEGASLSLSERIKITHNLVSIRRSAEVIPTIISNSYGDIQEYLKAVEDLPISAIMILPPSYFRPISDAAMIDFYKRLSDQTHHTIIAYNIPESALTITPTVLSNIPVWGVKDSSGSLDSVKDFLQTGKKLLVGSDALLAKAIQAGANGGICGISNLFPIQMVSAYKCALAGDFDQGQKIIDSIMEPINQILSNGSGMSFAIGTLKKYAKFRGPVDLGNMRPPLPIWPLVDEKYQLFKAAAAELDEKIK